MGIGEHIRRLREAKSMTQEELGEKLCITKSMVSQIERGTRVPSLPMAREIAELLGTTVDEL